MRRAALLCAGVLIVACGAPTGALAADSESAAAGRAARGALLTRTTSAVDVRSDEATAEGATAYRAHFLGVCDLYIPPWAHAENGKYDLIVHWHGVPSLQETNAERAHINAVVVSMNLGIESGAYSNRFENERSFPGLLDVIRAQVEKSHRFEGAQLGRVALSAWSAGFGAVGRILSQPSNAARADAVLLADGFHTSYLGNHRIYDEGLMKYVRFAELAERGERLMVMTHSSIGTDGYPSTAETTAEFLKLVGLAKHDLQGQTGPRGMHPTYETHRGSLYVSGFEGTQKEDHADHVRAMGETMYPLLKARWTPAMR